MHINYPIGYENVSHAIHSGSLDTFVLHTHVIIMSLKVLFKLSPRLSEDLAVDWQETRRKTYEMDRTRTVLPNYQSPEVSC